MSETPYGMPAAPPPPRPSRLPRSLLVFGLVALVAVYALAAFLTRGVWADPAAKESIRSTFTAEASDGSQPSAEAPSKTTKILQQRVGDLGGSPSDVVVDGDTFTVTVPSPNDDVRSMGERVQLYLRPVIHAIPSDSASATSPPPPASGPDSAQRIADEKKLRQSTDQQIQVLAMQFQTTRCDKADDLAGHDDPTLPLVTCSQDGKTVYLLAKSIISGEQIENARSDFSTGSGEWVVDLEFNDDAAAFWANFTAANVGTQTAFTIDSRVLSAPEIREAIPGGRTQISGKFTAASARDLAGALNHGTLPLSLSFRSSEAVSIAAEAPPTLPRIAVISAGVGVLLTAIFGAVFVVRTRSRPDFRDGRGVRPI
jgi:preprotein translocase subunit SecD